MPLIAALAIGDEIQCRILNLVRAVSHRWNSLAVSKQQAQHEPGGGFVVVSNHCRKQ